MSNHQDIAVRLNLLFAAFAVATLVALQVVGQPSHTPDCPITVNGAVVEIDEDVLATLLLIPGAEVPDHPPPVNCFPADWLEQLLTFRLYRGEGPLVERPAMAGGAVGLAVVYVPCLLIGWPIEELNIWNDFEIVPFSFAQGTSMIVGLPFYCVDKVFLDLPHWVMRRVKGSHADATPQSRR